MIFFWLGHIPQPNAYSEFIKHPQHAHGGILEVISVIIVVFGVIYRVIYYLEWCFRVVFSAGSCYRVVIIVLQELSSWHLVASRAISGYLRCCSWHLVLAHRIVRDFAIAIGWCSWCLVLLTLLSLVLARDDPASRSLNTLSHLEQHHLPPAT